MNYATYVEPIAVREDDESVPDFKTRARAILADRGGGCIVWGAPEEVEWVDADPEVIIVRGGVAEDASGDFAQLNDVLVERGPDETVEAFRIRARAAARAAGAEFVTFGGLPLMNYDNLEGE